MVNDTLKYFSTFSGIGGFELGIQYAYVDSIKRSQEQRSKENKKGNEGQRLQPKKGKDIRATTRQFSEYDRDSIDERQPNCVGYSETDKYAIEIYEKHFNHKNYGDITTINAKEVPDHDLFVGGFPCQAFSIAGKRGGFNDTRGTLFFDIARIVREKQPRLLLLENVKGLLSHDKGRTFYTIITTFDELGYDCQWQVLNSKNHGVPQNRERVFIIGHLRGTPRPQVFPFGGKNREDVQKGEEKQKRGSWISTLDARYGERWSSETYVRVTEDGYHGYRNDKKKSSIQGTHVTQPNGKSHALSTAHKPMTLVDAKVRRLTPLECERLQGFPDGWTEYGLSDILEICVSTNNAVEKKLLKLGSVSCTTKDGKDMEAHIYQNEKKEYASIVIDEPLPASSVLDTINPLRDMVMLYNQKEILNTAEPIKKKGIYERMDEKSTSKLWKITLVGNCKEEKLSIILTSIREIMKSLISTYAKTEEDTIGVIIHLNSLGQNCLKEGSLVLKTGNIELLSDTQRYKTLGNAVTVNVVRDIMKKLC